jgi:excinuclease ABC subunit C
MTIPAAPSERPDLRARLHEVPHKPGVYIMRDRLHRVIYVGKARDLRKRVSSYFIPSRAMTADRKTRALLDSVWDFEIHTVKSEPEALLLEGRLIKEFRPKYNVSFRDDKRFLLVRVDPREEWPRFRLTRLRKDDAARYFGPFAHAGALRQTMTFMRKKFGVLTFGRGSPTERERKSSTYQVPMKLAEITSEQYHERVDAACDFLAGQSREMLEQLEAEMKKAAEKLDFERAAELRNMLDDLRTTTRPVRKFTRHSLPGAIDPQADLIILAEALGLPGPPRVMECFDISNISTTHNVASMVRFTGGVPDRAAYRRYRIRTVEGQDDFASMAEVVRRRYSRVLGEMSDVQCPMSNVSGPDAARESHVDYSPALSQENPAETARRLASHRPSHIAHCTLPDLIIVDGGKGQLGSACRELQRLCLYDVPIIGLAKEFEEIHRPSHALPLRIPHESGAIKLLQRIRDEAHRFANGYHQLLMKRRVAESVLDEIPGVSPARKQALLRRFGSVARMRRASVDDIATVDGISRKIAEQIAEFFAARPQPTKQAEG